MDGTVFSEQPDGPIGPSGNPMMAAAWLAARIERIKIVANGPLLNAYSNPIRLAEEIATADIVSWGPSDFWITVGHRMQHHSTGIHPATAHELHRKVHPRSGDGALRLVGNALLPCPNRYC